MNFETENIKLYHGDCFDIIREMPDNSVDAVITDPPYGMGSEPDIREVMTNWLADIDYQQGGGGFMGKEWDSFVPNPSIWRECFRVLKPGGHILCFASTRTWDLMSIALRFAGFQMRDTIASYHADTPSCIDWVYASGFPKSLNISKSLDKMAGAEREVVGMYNPYLDNGKRKISETAKGDKYGKYKPIELSNGCKPITSPASPEAKQWEGWGTAIKPAHEPIIVARKPISEKNIALNVLKWGCGGLNIDACRIGIRIDESENSKDFRTTAGTGSHIPLPGNSGKDTKKIKVVMDNHHPLSLRHNIKGRFPANVIFTHHPECKCLGEMEIKGDKRGATGGKITVNHTSSFLAHEQIGYKGAAYGDSDGNETIENWQCHPDCPVRILNQQSGVRKSGKMTPEHKANGKSWFNTGYYCTESYGDTGYASRFFFCPKASPAERNEGLRDIKNIHETVKPIAIMEYLIKLVTPPGAVVLDPFTGSGTTGVACVKLDRKFIGIEKEPEYFEIAKKRIFNEIQKPKQIEMFL